MEKENLDDNVGRSKKDSIKFNCFQNESRRIEEESRLYDNKVHYLSLLLYFNNASILKAKILIPKLRCTRV